MKQILCICGSASENSSNLELLRRIEAAFSDTYGFVVYDELRNLPLFTPTRLKEGDAPSVQTLKQTVAAAHAVVISTPEYLHNIPAVLKNALEWMTVSGELADKPVLPITFTPAPPRGEYAMRSLLQSLTALKANVVAELPLYRSEMMDGNGMIALNEPHTELLRQALALL